MFTMIINIGIMVTSTWKKIKLNVTFCCLMVKAKCCRSKEAPILVEVDLGDEKELEMPPEKVENQELKLDEVSYT